MRTFKQYIFEIKSTIDRDSWKWVKSPNVWNAHQWDYDINLMIMKSAAMPNNELSIWDISFDVDFTTRLTGKGNANIIFSWVIERVIEFVTSVRPDAVRYTANKDERSRVDAYKTITRIVTRKLKNYEEVDIGEGPGIGYPFYLVRKDLVDHPEIEITLTKHNAYYG